MTNTLGNMNHKGFLVGEKGRGRTGVYNITSTPLPFILLFCSDGVKDVLDANEIALIISDLEKGLSSTSTSPCATDIKELLDGIRPGNLTPDEFDEEAIDSLINILMEHEDLIHSNEKLTAACQGILDLISQPFCMSPP